MHNRKKNSKGDVKSSTEPPSSIPNKQAKASTEVAEPQPSFLKKHVLNWRTLLFSALIGIIVGLQIKYIRPLSLQEEELILKNKPDYESTLNYGFLHI
jgi:hypothetical protein